MTPHPLLEICDLRVCFTDPDDASRQIEALKGVSLEVRESSFTSIVGESGSGKTVTSLSVTGLVKSQHTSGQILWHGAGKAKDLLTVSSAELLKIRGKEIAYVFQDPATSLNPVLKVGPQIAEAARAHFNLNEKDAKARTLSQLDAVQMKDAERVYGSYPHELSGGMRQRAMIAMALICEPRLLIADEPTTALDSQVEIEILNLLVRIKEEKKLSILFITHDMGHASAYSDVIYVMQKGLVSERLEKKAGKFTPQTADAKRLFSASFWNVPPKSLLEA